MATDESMGETRPEPATETRPTWQFSLRSLLVATTVAAFCAAWLNWFREPLADFSHYPGLCGLLSMLLVLAVPIGLARSQQVLTSQSAWTLMVIAWQLICWNIAFTSIKAFDSMGAPLANWIHEALIGILINSLTWPLFAILSVATFLLWTGRRLPWRTSRWLIASAAMCTFSTGVLFLVLNYFLVPLCQAYDW